MNLRIPSERAHGDCSRGHARPPRPHTRVRGPAGRSSGTPVNWAADDRCIRRAVGPRAPSEAVRLSLGPLGKRKNTAHRVRAPCHVAVEQEHLGRSLDGDASLCGRGEGATAATAQAEWWARRRLAAGGGCGGSQAARGSPMASQRALRVSSGESSPSRPAWPTTTSAAAAGLACPSTAGGSGARAREQNGVAAQGIRTPGHTRARRWSHHLWTANGRPCPRG